MGSGGWDSGRWVTNCKVRHMSMDQCADSVDLSTTICNGVFGPALQVDACLIDGHQQTPTDFLQGKAAAASLFASFVAGGMCATLGCNTGSWQLCDNKPGRKFVSSRGN